MTRTISLNAFKVDTSQKGSCARDRGSQSLEICLRGTGKDTTDTERPLSCSEGDMNIRQEQKAAKRDGGKAAKLELQQTAPRCGCSVISTKTVCSLHTSCIGDTVCIWAGNTVCVDCVFCSTDDHYTRRQELKFYVKLQLNHSEQMLFKNLSPNYSPRN